MSVSYPLDTTGLSPGNLITGEPHTLTEINDSTYRVLIPEFAPFYLDNLDLRYVDLNGTSFPLTIDVDYYVCLPYIGASRSIGKMIYGGIALNTRLIDGHLKLSYQTLGGSWIADPQFARERLAEKIYNPKTTVWDIITNKTDQFPPINHEQSLDAVFGHKELIGAVNALANLVANSAGSNVALVKYLTTVQKIRDTPVNPRSYYLAGAKARTIIKR